MLGAVLSLSSFKPVLFGGALAQGLELGRNFSASGSLAIGEGLHPLSLGQVAGAATSAGSFPEVFIAGLLALAVLIGLTSAVFGLKQQAH